MLVGVARGPGEFIDSHAVSLGDELTLSVTRGFACLGHKALRTRFCESRNRRLGTSVHSCSRRIVNLVRNLGITGLEVGMKSASTWQASALRFP